MTEAPPVAPAPPPSDLTVNLSRVELLCARLRPEREAELERVEWKIAKTPRGAGWDNVLWPVGRLAGRALVLRVVRREAARPLLHRETAVLRRLRSAGASLPMRVPELLASAEDAVLVPWYDGVTAAEVPAEVRSATAQALARMLAVVHSGPAPEIAANPVRGVPLATREDAFRIDLERAGLPIEQDRRARERWEQGLDAEVWEGRPLLLHGDPHPGNVVVPPRTVGGAPVLIDWGDTTRGDPASDLGALLLHGPAQPLLATYREAASWTGIEEDTVWEALVARARAWAVRMGLMLVTAYPADDPLGAVGHRALRA
ncbi:phosphotransferase [Brachybacterium sp. YJGR34]|uniref:phosphotransferase n=1 Tax=Brachybacterium sp. YJGR34 TaxID=2059911 RepID=UPI000E0B5A3F|nr:phosphotransferase [Brachybacterium sp. YJGR34]